MITELEEKKESANAESPKKTVPQAPRHAAWDDEEPEVSGFKKWRVPVIAGITLAGGIAFVAHSMSKHPAGPPTKDDTMNVTIVVPPPKELPPPPPPVQQQPEEKKMDMVEEEKQVEPTPDPAPAPTTNVKGPAASGGSLGFGPGGNGPLTNRNPFSAERQGWSNYAGQVSSRISQALAGNTKTRKARGELEIAVWLDENGRITRVKILKGSSDSAVDAAIPEILPGLQMSALPPQTMPMPIRMRIKAQRPN